MSSASAQHSIERLLNIALTDASDAARADALDELRKHGMYSCVRELVTILEHDPNYAVRWRAAEAIRGLRGTKPSSFIPSLIIALGDPFHWVRWHSRDVLRAISTPEERLPWLMAALHNNCNPEVRIAAIGEIRELRWKGRAAAELISEKLLHDPTLHVRVAAARALGEIGDTAMAIEALKRALQTDSTVVKKSAAKSLSKLATNSHDCAMVLSTSLGSTNSELKMISAIGLARSDRKYAQVVPLLVEALDHEDLALDAWDCIVMKGSSIDLSHVRGCVLNKVLAEIVARGMLPSIGVKEWHNGPQIEFPSRSYPWRDYGVFHSWESHILPGGPQSARRILSACFHADFFPKVHLIEAAQIAVGRLDQLECLPPRVEEIEVPFVLQSGGNIRELEGMRPVQSPFRTNRIDFVYGENLRMLQYLVFSAVSAGVNPVNREPCEAVAARCWTRFVESISQIFKTAGLVDFAAEEWFLEEGWYSSRYRVRYERPYRLLRPIVDRFLRLAETGAFKSEVKTLLDPILEQLESIIWEHASKHWPDSVIAAILDSAASNRVKRLIQSNA